MLAKLTHFCVATVYAERKDCMRAALSTHLLFYHIQATISRAGQSTHQGQPLPLQQLHNAYNGNSCDTSAFQGERPCGVRQDRNSSTEGYLMVRASQTEQRPGGNKM